MKKIFIGFAALAFASFSLVSCSDNDPNSPSEGDNSNNGTGGGSGSMEQYSPEESKQFLADVATQALNMFNPADQEDLINLCAYFSEYYGDLDLPSNFDVEEYDVNRLAQYFKNTGKALSTGDLIALTRASADYVYDINFNLFKGVYTPGRREWVKTADSNDVIFQFPYLGGTAELKAVGSSLSYNTSVEYTDEDWYWGDETYQFNFTIPNQIVLTLSDGSSQLANVTVETNVSFEAHNFKANVYGNLANIGIDSKATGNDTQISENTTITLSGANFIESSATINGNNLCNWEFYQRNADDEDMILANVLKNGSATVGIIGKVNVDASFTSFPGLFEGYDDEDEISTQAFVALLNQYMTAKVRYNNTTTEQAKINWTYTVDSYNSPYYNYTYYEIEPQLMFPDGTTYYFESYFRTGFAGVESTFESLIRRYQAIVRAF